MSRTSLYHQSHNRIQSELEIIEKAKVNPRHFSPLYNEYYESIFRYVIKRTNDKYVACDVTSNVFVKAITNISNMNIGVFHFHHGYFVLPKARFINLFEIRKQSAQLVWIK